MTDPVHTYEARVQIERTSEYGGTWRYIVDAGGVRDGGNRVTKRGARRAAKRMAKRFVREALLRQQREDYKVSIR